MTTAFPPYRILVTGWRYWPREMAYIVHQTLFDAVRADVLFGQRRVVVVDGWCPYGGVDEWAHEWAVAHAAHCDSERHKAKWGLYGKAAGMRRNQYMVDLGADICLGFPGPSSRGTVNCMNLARMAGIPVVVVPWDPAFIEGSPTYDPAATAESAQAHVRHPDPVDPSPEVQPAPSLPDR